jgi:hypothetical protein
MVYSVHRNARQITVLSEKNTLSTLDSLKKLTPKGDKVG